MCERRGVEGSKKDVMVEIDDIMDQSLEESLMIVYVNVPVSSEIVNRAIVVQELLREVKSCQ